MNTSTKLAQAGITVGDLIAFLEDFDRDQPVVVQVTSGNYWRSQFAYAIEGVDEVELGQDCGFAEAYGGYGAMPVAKANYDDDEDAKANYDDDEDAEANYDDDEDAENVLRVPTILLRGQA